MVATASKRWKGLSIAGIQFALEQSTVWRSGDGGYGQKSGNGGYARGHWATKEGESRVELALIVFLKSQVSALTLILVNHDFDNGLSAIGANAQLGHESIDKLLFVLFDNTVSENDVASVDECSLAKFGW